MGWRTVVVSGIAKLDLKMNNLVVRKEEIVKVNIDEIAILILESTNISITTALLAKLAEAKVKVIFCDKEHNPCSELVNYYNKHNDSLVIKNQISWSKEGKILVWTRIVAEKIMNQSKLLKNLGLGTYEMLQNYVLEIEENDKTNREGHAAKVYFNSLFGLEFTRGEDCPTNSTLNYGYSILLAMFNREIVASGYLTQLGISHCNQFNHFNLASDLMEPFRVIVDRAVVDLCPEKFDKEEKYEMYRSLSCKVKINDMNCELINAIGIYCKSIFSAIEKRRHFINKIPKL